MKFNSDQCLKGKQCAADLAEALTLSFWSRSTSAIYHESHQKDARKALDDLANAIGFEINWKPEVLAAMTAEDEPEDAAA